MGLAALLLAAVAVQAQDIVWERLPPPPIWEVYRSRAAAIDPQGTLYFGAHGIRIGDHEPRGLLRFPPGATEWQVIESTRVIDDVVVTTEGYLVADRFRLDRSIDGGVTWSEVHPQGEPLSRLSEGPFANTLFSGHEGPTGMTLRSDDAGATWHEPQLPPVHFHCRAFMAHPVPEHPERVLGACAYGIAVSDDGGLTFEASDFWVTSPVHVGYSLARLPDETAFAVVGGGCCAGGIYRSRDGISWEFVFNTVQRSLLVTVGHDLYAVVQPTGQVWHSPDGGESWTSRGLVYMGEGDIAVNAVVADLAGRLWASVSGAGPSVERFGVYRTVEPVISAEPEPEAARLALEVWSNPASGTATASFALDEPGRFRLAIFDVLGRMVSVAFEGYAEAGAIEVPLDLSSLSSGVYLLHLDLAGEHDARHAVRRLTIAR